MSAERIEQLHAWVAQRLSLPRVALEPVSNDASFRRYFRVHAPERTLIVMDAPPGREDCRPFVRVAALLRAAGVHAPEVLAADLGRGFLLLSDLGRQTYLEALNADNADALFSDAIGALIRWQSATRPGALPPYDRALLRRELELFPEWYLGRHLGIALTAPERAVLNEAFRRLEDSALAQPAVYVHRDYMPRNLMLSDPNPGVLDFQDAVLGPISYDILCLLKDAFISWEPERIALWQHRYFERARRAGLPLPEAEPFRRALDWMGLQRHLKVAGIFARLNYRDGKPQYLGELPRFIAYIRETAERYREFTALLRLLDGCHSRATSGAVAAP